ncbi:MAG TPA: bifunctional 5,10-methylene-tetrahydrofolate dehydrogenase/5,10-methylene-tetrahydrofolate cyclohydrolase [Nitrospiraceae bacterium]|nr:bifunctional 5,10-methylene-tetrahydrofolate dehydrogenase/5,10-methylene-tetrahydrofolate cyclohydrolase [Nitrospiraceae bacterium]
MAQFMKGHELSSRIIRVVKDETDRLGKIGIRAGLALVLVGQDRSSYMYYQAIQSAAVRAGIDIFNHTLPESSTLNDILNLIKTLNNDERASGILVFLPLPRHIDTRKVMNSIASEKDVDGQGSISVGRLATDESTSQLFEPGFAVAIKSTFLPCTPYGVMRMLEHYGIEPKGKKAVVVGKSLAVGKPLAMMLLAREATVTVCHRETADLGAETRQADILCSATGRPGLFTAGMVKNGAVVVDIGINVLDNGETVGDVDFEPVAKKASFITPVPSGVGPVTIAILMKNTVISAKRMVGVG